MGESQTHRDLKLALAETLKQFGYKTQVEKWFEGGRMDIYATNDRGDKIEIEVKNTHLPDRLLFIVYVKDKRWAVVGNSHSRRY